MILQNNKIEKRKRDKSAKEIMITSQSSSYGPNWAHIFRYSLQYHYGLSNKSNIKVQTHIENAQTHIQIPNSLNTSLNLERY